MDPQVEQFRIFLSEEELQLYAIDNLASKYFEWLTVSKETNNTQRKTRAANRRADKIYDEILDIKQLPPIQLKTISSLTTASQSNGVTLSTSNNSSSKSSVDGDRDSSGIGSSGPSSRCGRTLRPRCRTPSVTRKQSQSSPCTPTQQSLRAHLKKNADATNSNVLSAALNQQHPSVSVTKIRQLLRADSAQKKRDEEKERQEKMRLDRKAKEERAEQQKKQLLEERAITAKMKREQRLQHAAEVRRAREKAKLEQKAREEQKAKEEQRTLLEPKSKDDVPAKEDPKPKEDEQTYKAQKQHKPLSPPKSPEQPMKPLNETFQKTEEPYENIDISVHDDTQDAQKAKVTQVAAWAKAPYLRDALVNQFSKPEQDLRRLAMKIFFGVELPVDLEKIFGETSKKHLHRTSSAVWSTPPRGLKRTSSMVMTPTNPKR